MINLQQIRNARVLVVGDAMLDRYWHGSVDRISPEAPVPVVRVQKMEERVGGAANVAKNIATIGGAVSFVGVVGEDEAGNTLHRLLQGSGIESYLARDRNLHTTVKLRVMGRQQQLIRLDFESAPDYEILATQTESFLRLLPAHQAVVFSDYAKGGLQHIPDMIGLARSAGKVVLIDPKGDDYQRYRGASVMTPNRAELRQVVGEWNDESDLQVRIERLRQDLQLQTLLLTRSEEGMSLYDDAGVAHVRAQAREVFDVTGAGDTVIATMASLMAAGMTARQAMPHANRAGSIVVGKIGTASVSYDELFLMSGATSA